MPSQRSAVNTLENEENKLAHPRIEEKNQKRASRVKLTEKTWFPTAVRIVSIVVFLSLWEVYGRTQNPLTFAPISSVTVSLVQMLGTAELWLAFLQSFSTFIMGLGLALVIGIPVGLLMGQFNRIGNVMSIYMMFLIVLPMSALVPVITMVFGIDTLSRVVAVFLFSVPEIVMTTYAAVTRLDKSYLELGLSYCAKPWDMFSKIVFQASLPGIISGVKLGTARAIVGMVVAEMLIVSVGVGRLIRNYSGQFMAAELFAIVLLLLVGGVLILQVVQKIEHKLLHWKH